MKEVYIETTTIEIVLTNGTKIVKKDYLVNCIYQYGEVPDNTTAEFNRKKFFELSLLLGVPIGKTLFKKRLYIRDYTLGNSVFGRRIY